MSKKHRIPRYTILYVEDELWSMSGVVDRLSMNYNVIEARNADQALAFLESGEHKIDLILLDIMMPLGERIRTSDRGRTAGVEFARIVLEEKGFEIPVVCYTVVNDPVVHNTLYELGVKAVVSKTSLPSELAGVIRRHLDESEKPIYGTMQGRTILYVEDEHFLMSGVVDRLSMNYNVIEARNGDQALAFLESGEHKIGLILLDIMMPLGERIRTSDRGRTAGVEFARIVLEEKGFEIPIVCYTVANDPVVRNTLYQLGVKAIVSKTKLPSELEKIIANYLPKSRKQ